MTSGSVLVGLDGSEASRDAFRTAIDEARWREHALCVLHVVFVPMVMGRSLSLEIPENIADYGNVVVDRELDLLLEEYDGEFPVPVHRRIRAGHIGGELIAAVADPELKVQLVVLGTRGLGGFTSLVLGSVTTYAVSHLPVPVLIVPLKE